MRAIIARFESPSSLQFCKPISDFIKSGVDSLDGLFTFCAQLLCGFHDSGVSGAISCQGPIGLSFGEKNPSEIQILLDGHLKHDHRRNALGRKRCDLVFLPLQPAQRAERSIQRGLNEVAVHSSIQNSYLGKRSTWMPSNLQSIAGSEELPCLEGEILLFFFEDLLEPEFVGFIGEPNGPQANHSCAKRGNPVRSAATVGNKIYCARCAKRPPTPGRASSESNDTNQSYIRATKSSNPHKYLHGSLLTVEILA